MLRDRSRWTATVLIMALSASPSCAGQSPSTAVAEPPAHHEKGGYRNLTPHEEHGFFDFLKWWFGGGPKDALPVPLDQLPAFAPPVVAPDLNSINHAPEDAMQVTWIGYAAFLVQAGGLNILTDPMFSERASPLSFGGPKRLAPPGIALKDLPKIDAVIISHNHYDHLDADSVKALGNKPRYFVPLGFAARGSRSAGSRTCRSWTGGLRRRGEGCGSMPSRHSTSRAARPSTGTRCSGPAG